VFETVLFYEALWAQAGAGAHGVLVGFVLGAAALGVIAALVFRYGVRLPIGLFFGVSSAFLVALAVIFAGQGTAALQKAGVLAASPVGSFGVPALGVYPTLESLLAQGIVLALVLGAYVYMRKEST
jgi:high-affinity iron transporter